MKLRIFRRSLRFRLQDEEIERLRDGFDVLDTLALGGSHLRFGLRPGGEELKIEGGRKGDLVVTLPRPTPAASSKSSTCESVYFKGTIDTGDGELAVLVERERPRRDGAVDTGQAPDRSAPAAASKDR